MHKYDRKRGFTLIEILVVVAIIALLVSILLPSLRNAREQAKTVVCKSRLTQMYSGHAYYAADNKGLFPHWDWWLWDGTQTDGARKSFYPDSWIYKATGGVRSTDSRRWVEYGQIYRYVKDKEAYFCPSDNKKRQGLSIGSGGVKGDYAIHSYNRILDPHQFIQNKTDSRFTVTGAPPVINGSPVWLNANFINPDKLRPGVFKFAGLPQVSSFFSVPSRVGMMWEMDQGMGDAPVNPYTLNDGHASIVIYGTQDVMSPRHSQRKGHVLYWDGHPDLVEADRWNAYPTDKYVLYKGLGGGTPARP